MEAAVDGNLSGFRTVMLSLGLLAGVALLLTSVGLYGVLAYNVSQRANEFGVRLALGAPAAKMLSLVLNKGFQLVVAGLTLGIVGSLIGTRLVEQLLYETDRLDPFSFVGAAAFLAGVALIACIIPAWRAIRISPVEVLRRE
jgi:ABC-type antimicrobial peptide transport system permease subunit